VNGTVRRWLWRVGTAACLALLLGTSVAGQWRLITASVNGSVAPDRVSACLPGTAVPILPSPHVSQAAIASARYDSSPPTSGPHFPFVIAPGVYDSPIPDGLALHAMEHGHIVVHYAPGISPRDLEALRRLAKRYSRDVVLAPYPHLSTPVVVTAWARIDQLATVDEARITAFVLRLRGRYNHGWTRPDECAGGGASAARPVAPASCATSDAGAPADFARRYGLPAGSVQCCPDCTGCRCR
jgi:hypothetical protein